MDDSVRTFFVWSGFGVLALFIAVTIVWPLLCLLWAVIASAWNMWKVEDDACDHPECFEGGRYLHLPPYTPHAEVPAEPIKGAA